MVNPRIIRHCLAALFLVPPLCLCGCLGPDIVMSAGLSLAESGSSTFNKGSQEAVYARPFEDLVSATREMVAEFGLRIVSDSSTEGYLYLSVRDLTDSQIMLRIRRRAPRLTSISIRVGLLGDEPMSAVLMKSIDKRLAHLETLEQQARDRAPVP
jgi:hypothetical protein